jgi:beta-glucanase (GH16 family)
MLRFITIDTNAALHYYSHDNVRTVNGVLNITTEQKVNYYRAFDEKKKFWYVDKKYIQSGMVQTWNKFCFIGGIVEFRAKLPGDPHKGGLWPACKFSMFTCH